VRSLRISILSPVVATSIRTIRAANQTAAAASLVGQQRRRRKKKSSKGAISYSPHLA